MDMRPDPLQKEKPYRYPHRHVLSLGFYTQRLYTPRSSGR